MNSKIKTHGPIGTKLGTFIVDDNLTIENKYISLSSYNKLLIDSINMGLKWIETKVKDEMVDTKYVKYYNKFLNSIENYGYTNEVNQNIIEVAHDMLSKFNPVKILSQKPSHIIKTDNIKPDIDLKSHQPDKNSTVKNNHLGPQNLDNITDIDVDFSKGLMVQTMPGRYQLFLYVRHNDHWDILPYEHIAEKIKSIPNLLFNGIKIN